MAKVSLSEPDEVTLLRLGPGEQKEVARAISLLEDDWFRERNKVDLYLIEDGVRVWNLSAGRIWLAFVEESDGSITMVHLSLLSRFVAP